MHKALNRIFFPVVALVVAFPGPAPGANPPQKNAPAGSRRIDSAVYGCLKKLRIKPAPLCTDEEFVRRIHLDAIGLIPTREQVQAFLQDNRRSRRVALIEQLLGRKEFADYWAAKWSDLLRVKSEFPINLWPNATQAYYQWIWTSIRENKPYDKFVREMLTASGSNFRVAPVNFYRALQERGPKAFAGAVALTFMGMRAEKWPKARLAGMATFFSQIGFKRTAEWKEEVVFYDTLKALKDTGGGKVLRGIFPDGRMQELIPGKDPRVIFADWLIRSRNKWFAQNIVNRIWFWLQGRGIIHEVDDVRAGNPPVNPELLKLLVKELISSRYNLQHIFRIILNSQIYQLSCVPASNDKQAEANFAYYPIRRLPAEVLVDAVCQITMTSEEYSSLIPEPFTFIPKNHRTILLPDGSITSPFLEMFGRPSRDTGLEGERNNRPTAAQRLHFLNSSHIRMKIERGPMLRQILRGGGRGKGRKVVDNIYLTILSRRPTPEEIQVMQSLFKGSGWARRNGAIDLIWALLNSLEFQYRH